MGTAPARPSDVTTDPKRDCTECRSAGSVEGDVCQVCLANLGERPGGTERSEAGEPAEMCFSAAILELAALASAAAVARTPGADELASACRRVQDLFEALRRQFLDDIVSPTRVPVSPD